MDPETTICPNCKGPKIEKYLIFLACFELQQSKKKFAPAKYRFDSLPIKSKSELLICYFLRLNGINFHYERIVELNNKKFKPDFILNDGRGHFVIYEHFGMRSQEYLAKVEMKKIAFQEACKTDPNYSFIFTEERDLFDLIKNLAIKLNQTPFKKTHWE